MSTMATHEQAVEARASSRALQALSSQERQNILLAMADALDSNQQDILIQNALDVRAAVEMCMSESMKARLVLNEKKLKVLSAGLRSIAAQEEPLGLVVQKTLIADGLMLTQETVPIGVLLVIFESRPDCLPQIAGLSIRSGNGLLLKGGKECTHSNRYLHALLVKSIEQASGGKVRGSVIGLIEGRDEVASLLKLDGHIDLIIPRGSGELVKYIKANTSIPVMGHAEGICHVYVDDAASLEKAIKVVLDSKTDYPAACNAMETLLLHRGLFGEFGGQRGLKIVEALKAANVRLLGGPEACRELSLEPVQSFKTEYGNLSCSIEIVDNAAAAIAHIHAFGSGHTEAIVTERQATADQFLQDVDAACVFHNASTRFADGYRFGLGAEVGISTGKIHARGPVGVSGLCSTKWKLVSTSEGAVASEFAMGQRQFLHKKLL